MERQSEVLTGCGLVWSAGYLAVSGEIDLANASAIGHRIRALLGAGDLVVDCRAVTFLDAAGLRMLAQTGVAALGEHVVMRLRCTMAVTETLTLCGVRGLPGVVLDRGRHDRPGRLR